MSLLERLRAFYLHAVVAPFSYIPAESKAKKRRKSGPNRDQGGFAEGGGPSFQGNGSANDCGDAGGGDSGGGDCGGGGDGGGGGD